MRRAVAFLAVAVLVALAFFLPEWVSSVNDKKLLDNPYIQIQDEAQEGFAESIQLSVAEKVMLLRSGSMTVMQLDHDVVEWSNILPPDDAGDSSDEERDGIELSSGFGEENAEYAEAVTVLWKPRLEALQLELRSLQSAGGLPELWNEDTALTCTGYGDLLYMDPDTKMSFQVYQALLDAGLYTMRLTVDVQSGRILSFSLRWNKAALPKWGPQGASAFGGVWRNYWGLDSVSSSWYNDYTKNILEQSEDAFRMNGDFSSHALVLFTYDGQTLAVPLDCEAYSGRTFAISWNN